MSGLNQVRDAVIIALKSMGIAAIPAYEGTAKRHERAVVCVDVAASEGKPVGLSSYLGQIFDPQRGTFRELYGMQISVKVCLDVRSEQAVDCEVAMESAAETMMKGLPSGLRLGEMQWAGITWDKSTGMFLRKGTAKCRATFVAEDPCEDGILLDFILKGTMRH